MPEGPPEAKMGENASHHDPKSTKTARRRNRNRAPMKKKSLAESKFIYKIMRGRKPGLIKTVHLIPRTRGQRGLRQREWRTPPVWPEGGPKKKSEGECFAPFFVKKRK